MKGERLIVSAWLLATLGTAFALVGLVDLTLLWIPTRFQSVAWEFATIGRTFDGLPLTVLGLGLVAYGGSLHPRMGDGWIRSFAVLFGLITLILAFLSILLATAVPAVLRETPAETVEGVRQALVRSGVQAVVYPLAFGILTAVFWRADRS